MQGKEASSSIIQHNTVFETLVVGPCDFKQNKALHAYLMHIGEFQIFCRSIPDFLLCIFMLPMTMHKCLLLSSLNICRFDFFTLTTICLIKKLSYEKIKYKLYYIYFFHNVIF
jgi:hypothetical protein